MVLHDYKPDKLATPLQRQIAAMLRNYPQDTQGQIAKRCDCSLQTVATVVGKMKWNTNIVRLTKKLQQQNKYLESKEKSTICCTCDGSGYRIQGDHYDNAENNTYTYPHCHTFLEIECEDCSGEGAHLPEDWDL